MKNDRKIIAKTYYPDERIETIWLQTSGTGMQAFPMRWVDTSKPMSAEEYFNRITLNNQGNVKA